MAKKVLLDGKFTFNSVQYGFTQCTIDETHDEVDVTDTATTGDGREFLGTRANRTISITMWNDVNAADLPTNVEYAGSVDAQGKTYSGQIILLSKSVGLSTDNATQNTYNGRFNGAITETVAP